MGRMNVVSLANETNGDCPFISENNYCLCCFCFCFCFFAVFNLLQCSLINKNQKISHGGFFVLHPLPPEKLQVSFILCFYNSGL